MHRLRPYLQRRGLPVEQPRQRDRVQQALRGALDEEVLSILGAGSQLRSRLIYVCATMLFTSVSVSYFGRWLEVGGDGGEVELSAEMQQLVRGSLMAIVAASKDEARQHLAPLATSPL